MADDGMADEEAERLQQQLVEAEMERKAEELRVLAEMRRNDFTPKASLNRTPPHGFSTPMGEMEVIMSDIPQAGGKRMLCSPEEVREAVRRRVGAKRDKEKGMRIDVPPMGSLQSGPTSAATSPLPQATCEQRPELELDPLVSSSVEALTGLATASTRGIMDAVKAKTSKLNKDEIVAIGAHTERLSAVVMHLALRLAAAENRANLAEQRMAASAPCSTQYQQQQEKVSYASALRLPRRQEPVHFDVATGPTLAFYPADENGALKTAEETKTELKKAVDPAKLWVQVAKVRKVGNAGVLVQTMDAESANRLRAAIPSTLRVSEPKKRQPLICLNRLDGDPTFEDILLALHEQNFREDPQWPLERVQREATGAFKKNRSRGAAPATAAIFACSAELREALLTKGRVYVGWQAVEVTDYVDVTCCNKCQQYGHPERYCRSKETTCSRCGATGHRREECKASTSCCATCKRLGKKGAAGHKTASRDCPARLHAESRSVAMTQYGQ